MIRREGRLRTVASALCDQCHLCTTAALSWRWGMRPASSLLSAYCPLCYQLLLWFPSSLLLLPHVRLSSFL